MYGEDTAGNTNSFSLVFSTTDVTAPTAVILVSPINDTLTNVNTVEFVWNSTTDVLSGVSNYQLQVSTNDFGSTWSNVILLGTNDTIGGLAEGTNWWRVRAEDRQVTGAIGVVQIY